MRFRSIDLMRSTAIVIMVAVHFIENLAGVVPVIAGLGAPMFILLSGVSYRIWLGAQRAKGVSEAEIAKRTLRRGLFLFTVGLAFNVLVWLPEDVFNWDVLTLIGTGFVALEAARRMLRGVVLSLCALVLLLTPVLQVSADADAYWQQPYFDYEFTLPDVLLGYLVVGFFPLFPWIAFPCIGYVAGDYLFSDRDRTFSRAPTLAGVGAILLASSLCLLWLGAEFPALRRHEFLSGWTVNTPSLEYILGVIGFTMTYLSVALLLIDRPRRRKTANDPPRWQQGVTLYSRYSFTLYLLHHVVHVWPLWICGMVQGQETTFYWRQAVSVRMALILAGLFVVASFWLMRWVDRRRLPTVESGMRWFCD